MPLLLLCGGGSSSPSLIVFDIEMAEWLASTLGVACYPLKVPQEITDYPVLTYTLVDGDSEQKLSGPNGLAWRNYQFDAYSPAYADAATLAEQLRQAIQGLRGAMNRANIQVSSLHRESHDYESPTDGSDDGVFRFTSEYTLWYMQPRPAVASGL